MKEGQPLGWGTEPPGEMDENSPEYLQLLEEEWARQQKEVEREVEGTDPIAQNFDVRLFVSTKKGFSLGRGRPSSPESRPRRTSKIVVLVQYLSGDGRWHDWGKLKGRFAQGHHLEGFDGIATESLEGTGIPSEMALQTIIDGLERRIASLEKGLRY